MKNMFGYPAKSLNAFYLTLAFSTSVLKTNCYLRVFQLCCLA